MLGLAPDSAGFCRIPMSKRLQEFGAALRKRRRENLALRNICRHLPTIAQPRSMATQILSGPRPPGSHHADTRSEFDHPVTFDHALTMEWLNDGQHVRNTRSKSGAN